ncbi:unnamed protein product [Caenorhabditis nigoni]
MQPVPLSPLLAGYCNGFLASKIWANYLISLLTSSFIVQIECLVFCFIRKHQTIAKLTYRHVITDICQAGMRREDQMDYVRQNLPEYISGFSSLQNFVVYSVNYRLITMLALTFTGGLLCGIIFIMLTLDMLKMLKDIQRKVSVTSFRRYHIAVISLLAQFSTSFLLSVPLFIFLVLAASQIENSNWAAKVLVAVMPLYSPVNALVLVFTTPPYRNFVMRKSTKPRRASRTMYPGPNSLTRLKSLFSLN